MSNLFAHHLWILLAWPLAWGVVAAVTPAAAGRFIGIVATFVPVVAMVSYISQFDNSIGDSLQFVNDHLWVRELGIHFKLGFDGLNLWLAALTTVLFFAAALWATLQPVDRPGLFSFLLAIAEVAVLGAFVAQDLALFVLAFDLMLIPFFFIVGLWGGKNRVLAATKMVIYTLVGSLLMLSAAVATAVLTANATGNNLTFDLQALTVTHLGGGTQYLLFIAFALAFLIKMPTFGVHGWMPDAYRNMPLPALIVFAAVLAKVASYGFLRYALPLFPAASSHFSSVMLLIGLIAIILGSVQAFTQTDVRLIVGYSSIAQLGFILIGIFALRHEGTQGAIMQMINHGLVVAPLLLLFGCLANRSGSYDLKDMGGMAFKAPILACAILIASLATLAMPGSANFIGEFLILLGLFRAHLWVAVIAFTGVALASVYMLRALIRAIHNRGKNPNPSSELGLDEAAIILPLVALILAFAVYPQRMLGDASKSSKMTVESVTKGQQD